MSMIFAAGLTFAALLALATATQPPSSPQGCSDVLVSFSPCLAYVSARPNNLTDTATSQCCNAFSKAFSSVEGNCFCYLIKQPLIFGFPLNESRVISLPSVCALSSPRSLDSLCSGSSAVALPPLRSTPASPVPAPLRSTPASPVPADSDVEDDLLAPSLPPESVDTSPVGPVSPLAPARASAERLGRRSSNNWFLPAMLTSIVVFAHPWWCTAHPLYV